MTTYSFASLEYRFSLDSKRVCNSRNDLQSLSSKFTQERNKMSAVIQDNFDCAKKEESSVPGGRLERCIKNFWAFWFVALFMIGVDYVLNWFRTCPKINLKLKRTDQVCVITGGSGGIGFEIVKKLLQMDYIVILGVRNIHLVEERIKNIRKDGISTGHVELFYLDLKSLRSVKSFASKVLVNSGTNRIDLLINNAGIVQDKYEVTEDKLEAHFQVNYLSHFLLTKLLLPRIKDTARLKAGEPCHIINTSSCLHKAGCLKFDNLANKKLYIPVKCYFDTKLCQVMHAKSIQDQLDAEGVKNVLMYSVHPGVIPTDIWTGAGGAVYTTLLSIVRLLPLPAGISRTADEGASVILHPALNADHSASCGGKYFENRQSKLPSGQAENVQVRNRLWKMSMELVDEFLD